MDTSHVFNVEDLLPYRGTFEPSTLSCNMSAGETSKGLLTVPSLEYSTKMVDVILDDELVTSRDNDFRCFLVKWLGHPNFDAT